MTVRRQVLDFVQSRLHPVIPTTIESELTAPIEQIECPRIVLVDRGDTAIEPLTIHYPRLEERTGEFEVAVFLRDLESLKAKLSSAESQVETALAATLEINTANGLCAGLYKTGSSPSLSTDADQFAGRISLFYQYQYQVLANAPDVAL